MSFYTVRVFNVTTCSTQLVFKMTQICSTPPQPPLLVRLGVLVLSIPQYIPMRLIARNSLSAACFIDLAFIRSGSPTETKVCFTDEPVVQCIIWYSFNPSSSFLYTG